MGTGGGRKEVEFPHSKPPKQPRNTQIPQHTPLQPVSSLLCGLLRPSCLSGGGKQYQLVLGSTRTHLDITDSRPVPRLPLRDAASCSTPELAACLDRRTLPSKM